MASRKNEQRRESNQAILAHVKEEMDEPRMSQSAREQEESQPDHGAGVGKAATFHRTKGPHKREEE
jgi:hypothetical protein